MEREARPTAAVVVAGWALVEAALSTTDGPRLWEQHWQAVRALRRTFVRVVIALGTLFGAIAGMGAYMISDNWHGDPLAVVVTLGAGVVVLGLGLRRFTAATVAPLVPKPRHLWLHWTAAPLFVLVVLSGLLIEQNPAWAAAAGLFAAVPAWAVAFAEHRQPVPEFPAVWRPFLRD